MAIITINAEVGCKGTIIAHELAEKLGYLYFDHIIAEEIAEMLKINKMDVKTFEIEKHENIVATISKYFSIDIFTRKDQQNLDMEQKQDKLYSRNIRDSYKHLLPYRMDSSGWIDADIYKKMLFRVISAISKSGNCIILGRGGNIILKDEPNSFHFRFVGTPEFRKKNMVNLKGIPQDKVDTLIQQIDNKAITYNKYYFNFDVNDPHYYSAVLNIESIGDKEAIKWISKIVS